jgi:hypothetical protein
MADFSQPPQPALPFAGVKKSPTLPFRAVSAAATRTGAARADDAALPFVASPPAQPTQGGRARGAAGGPDEDEGDLSRTVARGKGSSSKRSKPQLTLEQFASLAAEVGTYPDRRAEIEARYGLDAQSHDLEKRAWALVFLDDRAMADRYTAKVKEFRQWLATGSTT